MILSVYFYLVYLNMIEKTKRIEIANSVIEDLGGVTRVAGICHLRPGSVGGWKKNGIPFAREQYLRLAYPRLKAWSTYR